MIGHHHIRAHTSGKHPAQFQIPGPDPVSPVAEIPPVLDINATKKLAPDAPGNDVIERC